MIVRFHEIAEDALLKFAVIIARCKGKWVLCKHRARNSCELPGGHRETGETILQAAQRELYEETGALQYAIEPVCAYSVCAGGKETFGMLYAAEIETFEPELHSEIERIEFFDALPDRWTYPMIQPFLLQEYARRMGQL